MILWEHGSRTSRVPCGLASGLDKSPSALSSPPAGSLGPFPSPPTPDGGRRAGGREPENIRTVPIWPADFKFDIVCKRGPYHQRDDMRGAGGYAKTCKSNCFKCKYIRGLFDYLCHLDVTLWRTFVETTARGAVFKTESLS